MSTPSVLGSHKLVAFVATRDPVHAKAFYGGTLGLRLVSEDRFALVFDANGTTLRVSTVRELPPVKHTVLGWEVPDIVAAAAALEKAGVKLERYGFPDQDERGIWTAPGGARVGWFKDPDGNTLSISQH
jgi:catechol 2,3-dioxygenase-like lactoylglutathione lyase family enzyme